MITDIKKAIVTGASSGIGKAICNSLVEKGWTVYGIGRDFNKCREEDQIEISITGELQKADELKSAEASEKSMIEIVCDITDTQKLTKAIKELNKAHDISLLINNAGVGYYGLHEELNPQKIAKMVRINFEAPMVLTNLLLRDLKKNQGTIINVSSITAEKTNPHGCAYGATKAGLTSFSHSLFEEARKYGVRVINIEPDMTASNLYRNADFTADDEENARILPQEVADAVIFAIEQRNGLVMTDITIRPQIHRIKKK